METFEEGRETKILEELSKKAVLNIFGRYFKLVDLETTILQFDEGLQIETGSEKPSREYMGILDRVEGLSGAVNHLGADGRPELVASATEFVLEGLHLNRMLNRDQVGGGFLYRK